MRVIAISNIKATQQPSSVRVGNSMFEHGGYMKSDASAQLWGKYDCEVIPYVKGIKINEDDLILFSDRNHVYEGWDFLRKHDYLKRTICIMIESDVVDSQCGIAFLRMIKGGFPYILTYQDDIVDNVKYFKYWPSIDSSPVMSEGSIPYSEKGLAAIICTNQICAELPGELYSERKRIVDFFETHEEYQFGVYGRFWEGYRNWGGAINRKSDAYHKYKFAICIENTRRNGYITEKLFDCFKNGIVPVYGGPLNVEKYIPKDCFIDYFSFATLEEMAEFLSNMDEREYSGYLNAIRNFMSTEEYQKFGCEEQIRKVLRLVPMLPEKYRVKIKDRITIFRNIGRPVLMARIIALKNRIPLLKHLKKFW